MARFGSVAVACSWNRKSEATLCEAAFLAAREGYGCGAQRAQPAVALFRVPGAANFFWQGEGGWSPSRLRAAIAATIPTMACRHYQCALAVPPLRVLAQLGSGGGAAGSIAAFTHKSSKGEARWACRRGAAGAPTIGEYGNFGCVGIFS